jgi:hypothetical protein
MLLKPLVLPGSQSLYYVPVFLGPWAGFQKISQLSDFQKPLIFLFLLLFSNNYSEKQPPQHNALFLQK